MKEVEMTWEELKLLITLRMVNNIRILPPAPPRSAAQIIPFPQERIVRKP